MKQQHFIFLRKADVITPQSLDDPDAGDIIRSVLLQGFSISPVHILAASSHAALDKFQRVTAGEADHSPTRLI
ncbi:hypothetical protein [Acerihabitans arboris]|uniref:Uncharacterized protein n=1 Tax=Acerihabitans arboris TaxID=2691583 RepID=A0A845SMD9_9GAMM|nr:hypothetical protein [Acerihabitans arboris]NDL64114.1 hypothetical protein [Acerihabitans arboris]